MGNMFDLNPAKMKALMKQMGMEQEEIDASKVTIEKNDGTKIIIENPHVIKLDVRGQESFQVSGNIKEEAGEPFTKDDIKQVMEKTECTESQAKRALENSNGDIAEAILEMNG